jgi:hypothetical protein
VLSWAHLMGSFASLRRRHRRGNPNCCAWSRTSRTGLTNRCTPPKRLGGNPLEARLRRCRWVTVRELVPTSQARLYPPLCAVAEAMSAGRGDMQGRVIWVRPAVRQRRLCPNGVFDRARACAQMGMLARGVGRRSPARRGPGHCSSAASLRLAEVRPAPAA